MDSDVQKKLHLVKWEKVTKGKEWEGLGVRNIRIMNDTLLLNGGGDLGQK